MGKMVPAAEFEANAIELLEEIGRTGELLTITRPDQSRLIVTASASSGAREPKPLVLGALKDVTTIHGDIVGPVDPDWEAKWDAKWDRLLSDNKRDDKQLR